MRLIVSLAIGAILSTLLAMLAAKVLPYKPSAEYAGWSQHKETTWIVDFYDVAPRPECKSSADAEAFARSLRFRPDPLRLDELEDALNIDFPSAPPIQLKLLDAGFPFRCVTGRECRRDVAPNRSRFHAANVQVERSGLLQPRIVDSRVPDPPRRWIPYGLCWVGLAGNTFAWGAGIWVLLFAMGTLRRVWRRRRGECTRCGYDRAGITKDAVCPECGSGGGSA
jgi:hypothetical protein